MDMSSLASALHCEKDSPLNTFEQLRISLDGDVCKNTVEFKDGNEEVHEIIKGMKLTKSVKKPINKKVDMLRWANLTQKRYVRYTDFMDGSKESYPIICKNITLINEIFEERKTGFKDIVRLVNKTDKLIVKVLKKFELIE